MKIAFNAFLLSGFLLSLASCFYKPTKITSETIEGDGKITIRKVEFGAPVVSLENSTSGDVKYEYSEGKSWLEIKTDSNIQEYILAETNEKGELSIYQKPEAEENPMHSNAETTILQPHELSYVIHSPLLARVLITGGGKFNANGKDGSSLLRPGKEFLLRVWGEGDADILFDGRCESMSVSAEHKANIVLREIATDFLKAGNCGEGTIKLQGNALKAQLNNEGSGKIDASELKCENLSTK